MGLLVESINSLIQRYYVYMKSSKIIVKGKKESSLKGFSKIGENDIDNNKATCESHKRIWRNENRTTTLYPEIKSQTMIGYE